MIHAYDARTAQRVDPWGDLDRGRRLGYTAQCSYCGSFTTSTGMGIQEWATLHQKECPQ